MTFVSDSRRFCLRSPRTANVVKILAHMLWSNAVIGIGCACQRQHTAGRLVLKGPWAWQPNALAAHAVVAASIADDVVTMPNHLA